MANHSLKDKTVLIAGGAKNFGGLIARDLAQHGAKAVAIHYNSARSKVDADETVKTAAALSKFSKTDPTDIDDVVPFIRFLVSDGWWITDQTILINGGYTTK